MGKESDIKRVVIREELCVHCGACVWDCSRNALFMKDQTIGYRQERCNGCGHCLAICKTGAVEMPEYGDCKTVPVEKDAFGLSAEAFLNLLKCRRSVRHFKKDPVIQEHLDMILEAGRYSPTGGNLQTNRFIVLRENMEIVRRMAADVLYAKAMDPNCDLASGEIYRKSWIRLHQDLLTGEKDGLFFDAPAVIVVTSEKTGGNEAVNGAIAASRMELTANLLGLGVCYIGFLRRALDYDPTIRRALGMAENEEYVLAFSLGHPDVQYCRSAVRKPAEVRYI